MLYLPFNPIIEFLATNNKNMSVNTESCFDLNETQEFKCQCKDGFDGKRCELHVCPTCENNGSCPVEISDTSGRQPVHCECPFPYEGLIFEFGSKEKSS